MDVNDKFWLAGYLEGEGSFLKPSPSAPNNPGISACSTDEDVIQHVAEILGVSYCEAKKKSKNPKHKRVWVVKKRGYHAVQIMREIQPLMGKRRQSQIQTAIDSYDATKSKGHKLTPEEVEQIKVLCQTALSQKAIAKQCGVCRELVNRIKNGKAHAA